MIFTTSLPIHDVMPLKMVKEKIFTKSTKTRA